MDSVAVFGKVEVLIWATRSCIVNERVDLCWLRKVLKMAFDLWHSLDAFLLYKLRPLPLEKLCLLAIEHINVEGSYPTTVPVVYHIVTNDLTWVACFVEGIVLDFVNDGHTVVSIVKAFDYLVTVVLGSGLVLITIDLYGWLSACRWLTTKFVFF